MTSHTPAPIKDDTAKSRIEVLDYVRGLAIIHIVLYHYYIEWFQGKFLIVTGGLEPNLERLTIFRDGGVLDIFKNFFSFLWVYGFTSVNLFLLLSGFVLTYSALKSDAKKITNQDPVATHSDGIVKTLPALFDFYVRKLKRLLIPFYITLILGIGILFLRNVLFPMFAGAPVYTALDVLKTLFLPFLVYDISFLQKFNGDLWFITLIMQLYILFPLFYYLLRKIGIWKLLLCTLLSTILYRFAAAFYIGSAPMGVIFPAKHSYLLFSFFLPRMFEFILGMAIGYAQFRNSSFLTLLSGVPQFFAGVVVTLIGFWLDSHQLGWTISDQVIAIGLFVTLLNIGTFFSQSDIIRRGMLTLSESSYENYLLHHYLLNYFLMPLLIVVGLRTEAGFWLAMPVFFIGSLFLAMFGQKLGVGVEVLWKKIFTKTQNAQV